MTINHARHRAMFLAVRHFGSPQRAIWAVALALLLAPLGAAAAQLERGTEDAAGCRNVRLSDVGWTDISATTAITAQLLEQAGYNPRIEMLSIPVTLMSLKNRDVDVFLGNWMPTQTTMVAPYFADSSVDDVGVNLKGARYTLAVPDYVYKAGVRSAADLKGFASKFKAKIYGIEPGNEGNQIILDMIEGDVYGLSGWSLVESSEQGMLTQVKQAVEEQDWVVFLGWQPHPMNTMVKMHYLEDPLERWGPGGGASEVHTLATPGLTEQCPRLGAFLSQLRFTVAQENTWMAGILNGGQTARQTAKAWLAAHPNERDAWLAPLRGGLVASNTAQRGDETATVAATTGTAVASSRVPKVPVGAWVADAVDWTTTNFSRQFRATSTALTAILQAGTRLLTWFHPAVLILMVAALGYALRRSWVFAVGICLGLALIWNMGYWEPTIETLTLVLTATFLSTMIGVPLGIVAAHRPWLYTVLRPILDLMQTIPTFVYLIPTLMLFGLGIVPGLISTVVFALPAPIRLTYLGVRGVPEQLKEAAEAFGARPMQSLWTIELPYARSTIMTGVNQALMLSLSMVVIAALVGAGGLGAPVVRALNTVNIAQGFETGLAIVILAIVLDRFLKSASAPQAGGAA